MRCKKCKENIVLYLYGDLSENEKLELEAHVKECAECTKELVESKQVFGLLEDAGADTIPEANWDRNWAKINATIHEKPSKQRSFLLVPRWAYGIAAVLLIFVLGIFTGRFWIQRSPELAEASLTSPNASQYILKEHFSEIRPLLAEFANYTTTEGGGETITIDRRILQNLLIQNVLLKRALSGEDPSTEDLLEDIDMVLREISNLDRQDSHASSSIKELIDDREILFKMNIIDTI
jgi:hypothetical protein